MLDPDKEPAPAERALSVKVPERDVTKVIARRAANYFFDRRSHTMRSGFRFPQKFSFEGLPSRHCRPKRFKTIAPKAATAITAFPSATSAARLSTP